jgi:hypothetical protein
VAASLQPNGWVLLIEDDAWVWGRVKPESDLLYDISGHCLLRFSKEHSNVILAHSSSTVYRNATCYGGSGGSFVNSSRLIGLGDYSASRLALLADLTAGGYIASDMIISAVILQDGGTIGRYKGYYDFVVIGSGIPKTFHWMKCLYFLKNTFG